MPSATILLILKEKTMPRVCMAEQYRPGAMGSLGNAKYMLLRQYQFPNEYLEREEMKMGDHDRLLSWDRAHALRCFTEHFRTGELAMERWLSDAKDEQVMAFLKDLLKADPSVQWTGYRIMGTVDRGNGYPVYTMQLFAKDPVSHTKTYTGSDAPNVRRAPLENLDW